MNHEQYRNARRAACREFYKVLREWKRELPWPPTEWTKIRDLAVSGFMDEWDATGRALGYV